MKMHLWVAMRVYYAAVKGLTTWSQMPWKTKKGKVWVMYAQHVAQHVCATSPKNHSIFSYELLNIHTGNLSGLKHFNYLCTCSQSSACFLLPCGTAGHMSRFTCLPTGSNADDETAKLASIIFIVRSKWITSLLFLLYHINVITWRH